MSTMRVRGRFSITRRSAGLFLAGAATSVFAPHVRASDDKTVYLLTWGGTIQQMLERDDWAAGTGRSSPGAPSAP